MEAGGKSRHFDITVASTEFIPESSYVAIIIRNIKLHKLGGQYT